MATPAIAVTAPDEGLTEAEARRRLRAAPRAPAASSRSYASIVRANVLTVFNLILVVFGVLVIAFGDWRDALFLGVIVANSAIGIFQEVRAKRALDRLAALVAPTATVVRDGAPRDGRASTRSWSATSSALAGRRPGRRRRPARAAERARGSTSRS